ncbi:unnamed protein product, partial [Urochloa humidicola]
VRAAASSDFRCNGTLLAVAAMVVVVLS